MDLDDFRIPDTPQLALSADSLPAPRSAPSSSGITGLGLNAQHASSKCFIASRSRPRELEVETQVGPDDYAFRAPVRVPGPASKPRQIDKGPPRPNYFSALTQRFQQSSSDGQPRMASSSHTRTSISQNAAHLPGEVVSYPERATRHDRPGSQPWDSGQPARNAQQNNHIQPTDVDAGFRGIQDAITTRFQDLEKKLQLQEQEITELRFSLNDAGVTADLLETDKRQLKQKNEELERKIAQSDGTADKLREEIRKTREELRDAVTEQKQLKLEVEKGQKRAVQDHGALLDARKTTGEVRAQLEATRRELREADVLSKEKVKQAEERADSRIQDLTKQLQRRDAELQAQRDANDQLAKKLDTIPERNFQALTTCVKKIVDKLDDSKSQILADGKANNKQHQEQHGAMVECLKGLLTASQQHVETLATSQQENETLSKRLLDKIQEYYCIEKEASVSLRTDITDGIGGLRKCMESYQASLDETFAAKTRESETLASFCQQREEDSENISNQLSEQRHVLQNQLHEIRELHNTLRELHEAPREDPRLIAKIAALQEQNRYCEGELRDKEVLITRLEESYKERTKELISASEKFASDIQQLNNTFHKREEEYRRSVDQASDLAVKEAKRVSEENKQETTRDLQQERTRRQSLEKELRQIKEDLSVIEEKGRRSEQSNEVLQSELATAKLGNQAVTAHLEEKTRTLEHRLDHDTTVITQLKAALADKEMDFVNLRSSMEAYDKKVRVLIEHLRGWAQDYTHIGAIRSRLEMLSQIDQSCAATARIREAEQIDNVLAQLRQYYARQNERDGKLDFAIGQSQAALVASHCPSDEDYEDHEDHEDHDQHISDLSAFLDAEVAAAILGNGPDSLKTPANIFKEQSSGMKPPPLLKDRVVNVAPDPKGGMGAGMSSPMVPSPMPKRPRRETRSSAANKAAMRNPVSPTDMKMALRAKRKRPAATSHVDNKETKARKVHTETSVYFQDTEKSNLLVSNDGNRPPASNMANSPSLLIKIEDP